MGKYQDSIPPDKCGISIYQYWADRTNKIFKDHGVTKKASKIDPSTFRHGLEEKIKRKIDFVVD